MSETIVVCLDDRVARWAVGIHVHNCSSNTKQPGLARSFRCQSGHLMQSNVPKMSKFIKCFMLTLSKWGSRFRHFKVSRLKSISSFCQNEEICWKICCQHGKKTIFLIWQINKANWTGNSLLNYIFNEL